MYSSFKVDSPTTPINELGTVKSPIMNEDVKLSNASPFMLNIMTEVVLANIHRFDLIAHTYIDYLIKVSEILTDQIILVRCYAISVFKVSRELNKVVIFLQLTVEYTRRWQSFSSIVPDRALEVSFFY